MASNRNHLCAPLAWLGLVAAGMAMAHEAPVATQIVATEAWIRWLPANLPAGGYLTLRNESDQPRTLVSVSSPDYGTLSLHHSALQGSMSSMQAVPALALPPHQTVNFAAGGYHIMLEHAARPLQPGDHVAITLHFADGTALVVPFEVRGADAGGAP